MTSEDHNKVIGIMHLVYGGMNAIALPFVVFFILMGLGMSGLDPNAPPEVGIMFVVIGLFFGLLFLIFGLPQLIAGYGLLRRKSWGRTWGIVASIMAAISFPLGTGLCVYTLWFLFGEGKNFYEGLETGGQRRGTLPNASTFGWDAREPTRARPVEYAPPPQPPNWRDEV
jgi:hypothetical protein